ncbi:MAG: CapA family protein, partial [Labilithrix sp.]|nr:CapA family protein [Labilithrix sp.]
MTGRGVDQILPYPSAPRIYEDYLRDARDYVALAEGKSGPIARPVGFEAIWGDALVELRRATVRVVNLETSVTESEVPWPGKGISYRMSPRNVGALTAAGLDVCVLANNHVLDWERAGLVETLETIRAAGMQTAGAGRDAIEAEAPAIVELPGGRRLLVVAVAEPMSGVPLAWAARPDVPGVALVRRLDDEEADAIAARLERVRRRGDV